MLVPLMYAASSDKRNRTTAAMSSGWARRRSGVCSSRRSRAPGISSRGASSGVSTAPGQTELTRMPSGPSWAHTARVKPSSPALEAQYAGRFGLPTRPSIDEMYTMAEPGLASSSDGCNSRVMVAAARRLTSST